MVVTKLENARQLLEDERDRIIQELKKAEDRFYSAERYGFSKERAEAAMQAMERNKQNTLVRHLRERLAEVEQALKKLEGDTYGLCDSCGKPILPARLEILPQAILCLNCKSTQGKIGQR